VFKHRGRLRGEQDDKENKNRTNIPAKNRQEEKKALLSLNIKGTKEAEGERNDK